MLRRPPTAISPTPDDLAFFEKQYAQGQIYANHHETTINSDNSNWQQQQNIGTPGSSRGEGQVAAGVGVAEGAREQVGGEERRVKTREERIQGITAAGGAVDGSAGSGAVSGNGMGRVAGATQQQPQR